MALTITHTPVFCTDLDEALAFYTQRLGFEVHDDVPMGPEMRWLTVHAPGDTHDLLLAAVDHHIPPADRQVMRELVAKGDLAVFVQVDDLDKVFESLRAAGTEILQEPIDQPYGVRDAGRPTPRPIPTTARMPRLPHDALAAVPFSGESAIASE